MCDFYLWGYLKGTVYQTNPRSIHELKNNLMAAIQAIDVSVLRRVCINNIDRAQKCVSAQGRHFQHLL